MTTENSIALRDLATGTALYLSGADFEITCSYSYHTLTVTATKRDPVAGTSSDWQFNFGLGSESLTAGRNYVDSSPWDNSAISVRAGRGGGPLGATGEFYIHTAEFSQGQLTALHVTFRQFDYANDTPPEQPLIGEIRYGLPARPANEAPTVVVGSPQYLAGTLQTVLSASAEDDFQPVDQPLTFGWSVLSGPGLVTFTGNGPRVTAEFAQRGQYVLAFTASDGVETVTRTVPVTLGTLAESYHGLISSGQIPYGRIVLRVLPSGVFTGVIPVGGDRIPLSGKLGDAAWGKTFPLIGGGRLFIALERSPDHAAITGTMNVDGSVFGIEARQDASAFLQAARRQTEFAGAYTWLTDFSSVQGPYGASFGITRVTANGGVIATGRLASGSTLSCGSAVALDRTAALYWETPYREQFGGRLTFASSSSSPTFSGDMPWLRFPLKNAARFAIGFGIGVTMKGESYRAPAAGANALTRTRDDAAIWSNAGALEWDRPREVESILGRNHLTRGSAGLTFRVNPRTGLFAGTVLGLDNRPRAIAGALLQSSQTGGGYFLDAHGTGYLVFSLRAPQ